MRFDPERTQRARELSEWFRARAGSDALMARAARALERASLPSDSAAPVHDNGQAAPYAEKESISRR